MTGSSAGARLDGRVVILTGAAGNIGTFITRALLREGARVTMTGRNGAKLEAFREVLMAEGVDGSRMLTQAGDAADPNACRQTVTATIEAFGRLDVLINNAGSAGPKQTLENLPITEGQARTQGNETIHDAAMNLLGGPWNMTRAAVPSMSPGGSIINVSTIFSRTPYFGRIPYVVPKSALNSLSLGLARELGRGDAGLRVNTVYPGPIESERIDTVFAAMDGLQGLEPGTTSKNFRGLMLAERQDADGQLDLRYPTPTDVAGTVLWLSSDESAAFSGHAFEVTNGMQVPAQDRFKLVSWPDGRLVDLQDRVVLVLGGSDIDEALVFADKHIARGAKVAVAFRTLETVGQARGRIRGSGPRLLHVDPLRPETTERALSFVADHYGRLDGVVVLPAGSNGEYGTDISTATDAEVESFIRNEVVGAMAFASTLAKRLHTWNDSLKEAPAVAFVSRPSDGQGNHLSDVSRSGIEALLRVWRHEEAHQVEMGQRAWACRPNQLVRYDNTEEDNLAFTADWTATLTNRVRKMDAINLWLPDSIRRATGKSSMPFDKFRVLPGLHRGKTAVITGGSLGIGKELGRFLALAGARVLLSARSAPRLETARDQIVSELRELGYGSPQERVFTLSGIDVGDETALHRLYEHSIDLFGHVDFLINNAGISGAEEMVVDMELSAWNRTLEANLISNYSLIRKFAPHMKKRGRGHILNVSSYFGGEKYLAVAYPNRADYSVSKAGQRSLAEILSRHLGPEIQINALAPGPVDGARLRGSPESPGLFARRGRLIMENKRLNRVHEALLAAVEEGRSVADCLEPLAQNVLEKVGAWEAAPPALKRLFAHIAGGRPNAASSLHLLNRPIAEKLLARLEGAGRIQSSAREQFLKSFVDAPEPFFDPKDVQRAAEKIEAGILDRLHLHKMPTDEQVGLSTVFHLADEIVSGETFHPSGGLKFERSVTEGELMFAPGREALGELEGRRVVLIGEAMQTEMLAIARGFLSHDVAAMTVLTESEAAADSMRAQLASNPAVDVQAVGSELERGLMGALSRHGQLDVVVSTPFARLPLNALAAEADGSWDRVLSRDDFARLIETQLTHHFRIAKRAALLDRCQVVLVTPDTSRASTREEFALALFSKNSLHAFTVTLGVEGERLPTMPAVNQVQLTRRARSEEPGNDQELEEEMGRMVAAVLQCSLPAPSPKESRYLARIFRGNAVTV